MTTQDELKNFVEENTIEVITRNWYNDIWRAEKAEAEVQRLREINDVLSEKLDSMIIVNGQALACSAPIAAEVERLQVTLDEARRMFDMAAKNAVALYRQGALDWNNKLLPPDDNVLLHAGLQCMFDEPSPARDIEWHDQLSECRLENARLCKQVSTLRKVLRRMDWLEAGDEVSGSDVIAMREALEATA